MTTHVFADETKAKGYLFAATTGPQAQLAVFRKELNGLILPRQRGLHMKDEKDARRREIADTIVRVGDLLGVQAIIYDAGRVGTEKDRRARCLGALIDDTLAHEQARIVLDRDESLVSWDKQQFIELTRAAGTKDRITYEHCTRHSELLLAIPDAIAWSWARGGEWRTRIKPIVAEVRAV